MAEDTHDRESCTDDRCPAPGCADWQAGRQAGYQAGWLSGWELGLASAESAPCACRAEAKRTT